MPRVGRIGWSRRWFRLKRWIFQRDNCEYCDGTRGVRGNENLIGNMTICDYCHVDLMMQQEDE